MSDLSSFTIVEELNSSPGVRLVRAEANHSAGGGQLLGRIFDPFPRTADVEADKRRLFLEGASSQLKLSLERAPNWQHVTEQHIGGGSKPGDPPPFVMTDWARLAAFYVEMREPVREELLWTIAQGVRCGLVELKSRLHRPFGVLDVNNVTLPLELSGDEISVSDVRLTGLPGHVPAATEAGDLRALGKLIASLATADLDPPLEKERSNQPSAWSRKMTEKRAEKWRSLCARLIGKEKPPITTLEQLETELRRLKPKTSALQRLLRSLRQLQEQLAPLLTWRPSRTLVVGASKITALILLLAGLAAAGLFAWDARNAARLSALRQVAANIREVDPSAALAPEKIDRNWDPSKAISELQVVVEAKQAADTAQRSGVPLFADPLLLDAQKLSNDLKSARDSERESLRLSSRSLRDKTRSIGQFISSLQQIKQQLGQAGWLSTNMELDWSREFTAFREQYLPQDFQLPRDEKLASEALEAWRKAVQQLVAQKLTPAALSADGVLNECNSLKIPKDSAIEKSHGDLINDLQKYKNQQTVSTSALTKNTDLLQLRSRVGELRGRIRDWSPPTDILADQLNRVQASYAAKLKDSKLGEALAEKQKEALSGLQKAVSEKDLETLLQTGKAWAELAADLDAVELIEKEVDAKSWSGGPTRVALSNWLSGRRYDHFRKDPKNAVTSLEANRDEADRLLKACRDAWSQLGATEPNVTATPLTIPASINDAGVKTELNKSGLPKLLKDVADVAGMGDDAIDATIKSGFGNWSAPTSAAARAALQRLAEQASKEPSGGHLKRVGALLNAAATGDLNLQLRNKLQPDKLWSSYAEKVPSNDNELDDWASTLEQTRSTLLSSGVVPKDQKGAVQLGWTWMAMEAKRNQNISDSELAKELNDMLGKRFNAVPSELSKALANPDGIRVQPRPQAPPPPVIPKLENLTLWEIQSGATLDVIPLALKAQRKIVLVFRRVQPGSNAFLCTTEASVDLVAECVNLEQSLVKALQVSSDLSGRTWRLNNKKVERPQRPESEASPNDNPTKSWARNFASEQLDAVLRAAEQKRNDLWGGKDPSDENVDYPLNNINPQVAETLAKKLGMRLPTAGEMRAAAANTARDRSENRRDESFEKFLRVAKEVSEKAREPFKNLYRMVNLYESGLNAPANRNGAPVVPSDNAILLRPLKARPSEFTDLDGNVAEWIKMDDRRWTAIGHSAFRDGQSVEANGDLGEVLGTASIDIGFRLAFTADVPAVAQPSTGQPDSGAASVAQTIPPLRERLAKARFP